MADENKHNKNLKQVKRLPVSSLSWGEISARSHSVSGRNHSNCQRHQGHLTKIAVVSTQTTRPKGTERTTNNEPRKRVFKMIQIKRQGKVPY